MDLTAKNITIIYKILFIPTFLYTLVGWKKSGFKLLSIFVKYMDLLPPTHGLKRRRLYTQKAPGEWYQPGPAFGGGKWGDRPRPRA
jgi:hypothetical protein